jgi:hypothetical protein
VISSSALSTNDEDAMPEIEVPTEHLHETIHEHVHKAHGNSSEERWTMKVAVTAALLAAFAAVTALFAGHYANEALLEQIEASDGWSHYQAKSIKSYLFTTKLDMLTALGKDPHDKDKAKLPQYEADKKKISEKATHKEKESRAHLNKHNILSKSVTFFQVAIAIAALTVLTRRRELFYFGLLLGLTGVGFLVHGLVA